MSAFCRIAGESDERNTRSGSTVVAAAISNSDAAAMTDLMCLIPTLCSTAARPLPAECGISSRAAVRLAA